jgi:hypothetical protein
MTPPLKGRDEPKVKEGVDSLGRTRPTFAPRCCNLGIHVIHPGTGRWACSECEVYGPARGRAK